MGQESTVGTVKQLIAGYDELLSSTSPHSEGLEAIRTFLKGDEKRSEIRYERICWHLDRYIVDVKGFVGSRQLEALETYPLYIAHMRIDTNQCNSTEHLYFVSDVVKTSN